jgi:hypothetical protein
MKILSYKDVNVDYSEEIIEATKVLGENFWYKSRVEKVEALNIWAEIFNREMKFSIPINFELEKIEEPDCSEENERESCCKIPIKRIGKISLVTSIYNAAIKGICHNITFSENAILDIATGEVLDELEMYNYVGFTACAYALNIYRICFPDKYDKAVNPEVENIKLLIR